MTAGTPHFLRASFAISAVALAASMLVACGGRGGGGKGSPLGSATTDSNGIFTMTVQPCSGPVMFQVHGGSYMDEATGTRMSMLSADDMSCALSSITVTAGSRMSGIQVTPLIAMAQTWAAHMPGGMTTASIDTANSHIGEHYVGPGADIVMTQAIDPTVMGSANGPGAEAKNYGIMLAAMSCARAMYARECRGFRAPSITSTKRLAIDFARLATS
jgi:hypothetical protein